MALTEAQAEALDAARALRIAGNPYMTADMISEQRGATVSTPTLAALAETGMLSVAYMVTDKGMTEHEGEGKGKGRVRS